MQVHSLPCNLTLARACMAVRYDVGARQCEVAQVNFDLEYTTSACPHKHDLGLSVPNEFVVLPPDTMVVAVFRWGLSALQPCKQSHDSLLGTWHDSATHTSMTTHAYLWSFFCRPAARWNSDHMSGVVW